MRCTGLIRPFAWAVVVLTASVAFAQTSTAPISMPGEGGKVDPKADAILKKMCGFLEESKNLTFVAEVNDLITVPGQKMETSFKYKVSVQHPARFAIVLDGQEPKGWCVYNDGKELVGYVPADKKYLTDKAEDTIDATITKYRPFFGNNFQFNDLIKNKAYQGLMEDVASGELGDKAKVGGVEAQELHFTQQGGISWSIWIETGDKPWPRKMAGEMVSPDGKSKRTVTILLSDWAVPADLPESTFTFKAPEGVEKVDPNKPEKAEGSNQPNPESLVGQPAPDFKLAVLGGGEVELSKLKGQVVVLDFWATWCPPCREGLPIVTEVTDSMKDKGVVFYAVNQQEDEKTIQSFLDRTKLKLNVALDSTGKVGNLYQLDGIPQTVIIGKDGKVAKVHVGLSPDLKAKLTKDLESLLTAK